MANEAVKQMWETTFMLKNGQGVALHHDIQPQDLDNKMQVPDTDLIEMVGTMIDKAWPVYFRCARSEILGWYSKPHAQYLGDRPKLLVQ
jgi:hypothetical protein